MLITQYRDTLTSHSPVTCQRLCSTFHAIYSMNSTRNIRKVCLNFLYSMLWQNKLEILEPTSLQDMCSRKYNC